MCKFHATSHLCGKDAVPEPKSLPGDVPISNHPSWLKQEQKQYKTMQNMTFDNILMIKMLKKYLSYQSYHRNTHVVICCVTNTGPSRKYIKVTAPLTRQKQLASVTICPGTTAPPQALQRRHPCSAKRDGCCTSATARWQPQSKAPRNSWCLTAVVSFFLLDLKCWRIGKWLVNTWRWSTVKIHIQRETQ